MIKTKAERALAAHNEIEELRKWLLDYAKTEPGEKALNHIDYLGLVKLRSKPEMVTSETILNMLQKLENSDLDRCEKFIENKTITPEQYSEYKCLLIAKAHDDYCNMVYKKFRAIVDNWYERTDKPKSWHLLMLNELGVTVEEFFRYDSEGDEAPEGIMKAIGEW